MGDMKRTSQMYCGLCHTCGTQLIVVLDGEEWCPRCRCYRRYRSHGWSGVDSESDGERCPDCRAAVACARMAAAEGAA